MTGAETGQGEPRACAGVVLYAPDPALLARQADGLAGRPLFVFVNGPVEEQALSALAKADLRVIRSEANVGLGLGLNAVTHAALRDGFSHIMLLDQDSEPPPACWTSWRRAASRWSAGRRSRCSPRSWCRPRKGSTSRSAMSGAGPPGLTGSSRSISPRPPGRWSTLPPMGRRPFRDDFFIAGIDVEWGFRAWDRGWASYLAPDLAMPHRWGEAVSADELGKPQILRHSRLRNYYYARNVVATARLRHVPWRWRAKSCARWPHRSRFWRPRGRAGRWSRFAPAWPTACAGGLARSRRAPLSVAICRTGGRA